MLTEREQSNLQEDGRLRRLRIVQARRLANEAAKRIRQRVQQRRVDLEAEVERFMQDEMITLRNLELEKAAECIEKAVEGEVGSGFEEACAVDRLDARRNVSRLSTAQVDQQKAVLRFEEAQRALEEERQRAVADVQNRRASKKKALEKEASRTIEIISRPAVAPSEAEKAALELKETKRKPFAVLESNVYSTTRYHLDILPDEHSQGQCDPDNATDNDEARPKNKKAQAFYFPLIEQTTPHGAKAVVKDPTQNDFGVEAEVSKRNLLLERARIRGQAALKKVRQRRKVDAVLSKLSEVQLAVARDDALHRPPNLAVALSSSAACTEQVERQKRLEEAKREEAFRDIVTEGLQVLQSQLPQRNIDDLFDDTSKEDENESTLQAEVLSAVASQDQTVRWQDVDAAADQSSLPPVTPVETGSTFQSDDASSLWASPTQMSHLRIQTEPIGLFTADAQEETQIEDSEKAISDEQHYQPVSCVPSRSDASIQTEIQIEPPAAYKYQPALPPSDQISSTIADMLQQGHIRSVASSCSTDISSGQSDRFQHLLGHNRDLMDRIESQKRRIEEHRRALGSQLDRLRTQVRSRTSSLVSAGSTLTSTSSTSSSFMDDAAILLQFRQAHQQLPNKIATMGVFSPPSSSSFSVASSIISTGLLPSSTLSDSSSISCGVLPSDESSTSSSSESTSNLSHHPIVMTRTANNNDFEIIGAGGLSTLIEEPEFELHDQRVEPQMRSLLIGGSSSSESETDSYSSSDGGPKQFILQPIERPVTPVASVPEVASSSLLNAAAPRHSSTPQRLAQFCGIGARLAQRSKDQLSESSTVTASSILPVRSLISVDGDDDRTVPYQLESETNEATTVDDDAPRSLVGDSSFFQLLAD